MEKYKKLMYALIIIASIVFMAGCDDTKLNNQKEVTSASNINEASDNDADIQNIVEIKKTSTYNSYDFIPSNAGNFVFSDKGFYMISEDFIYFYDNKTKLCKPLCQNISCNHNDENCNAYINNDSYYDITDMGETRIDCLGNMMWYDVGNIYMIMRDITGDYLVCYDEQLTNKRILTKLTDDKTRVGSTDLSGIESAIYYSGYLYYMTITIENMENVADKDYMVPMYCNRIELKKDAVPKTLGIMEIPLDTGVFGVGYGCVKQIDNKVYFLFETQSRLLSENQNPIVKTLSFDLE